MRKIGFLKVIISLLGFLMSFARPQIENDYSDSYLMQYLFSSEDKLFEGAWKSIAEPSEENQLPNTPFGGSFKRTSGFTQVKTGLFENHKYIRIKIADGVVFIYAAILG